MSYTSANKAENKTVKITVPVQTKAIIELTRPSDMRYDTRYDLTVVPVDEAARNSLVLFDDSVTNVKRMSTKGQDSYSFTMNMGSGQTSIKLIVANGNNNNQNIELNVNFLAAEVRPD